MIITFCGHRDFVAKKGSEAELLSLLEDKIGNTPVEFYLEGYGAFDAFAYECALKYKAKHSQVSLVFITPYLSIEYQRNHLQYQKERYDAIIYPEIEKAPLRFAISYRNRWMVERADLLIAYVKHDWGGAYQTYRYAKRKGKVIYNLAK